MPLKPFLLIFFVACAQIEQFDRFSRLKAQMRQNGKQKCLLDTNNFILVRDKRQNMQQAQTYGQSTDWRHQILLAWLSIDQKYFHFKI
jgi:hypothetical protein